MAEVIPEIIVGASKGSGANGDCFKATMKLGQVTKEAVIKYCNSSDPYDLRRFMNEAAYIQRLNGSDHIIGYLYGPAVNSNGQHYYLIEEADCSLQDVINDDSARLTFDEIVTLLIEICEGIQSAHHRSIVHRDLHPGNVLLANGDNTVKICDFGKARSFEKDWEYASQQEWHVPKHVYVSPPERFFLIKSPDSFNQYAKVDIYSVGMIANTLFQSYTPHLTYFLPLQADINQFLTKHKVAQTVGVFPGINPHASFAKRKELYELWLQERQVNEQAILKVDIKGASATQMNMINGIILKCVHPDHNKRYNSINEVILELKNVSNA